MPLHGQPHQGGPLGSPQSLVQNPLAGLFQGGPQGLPQGGPGGSPFAGLFPAGGGPTPVQTPDLGALIQMLQAGQPSFQGFLPTPAPIAPPAPTVDLAGLIQRLNLGGPRIKQGGEQGGGGGARGSSGPRGRGGRSGPGSQGGSSATGGSGAGPHG